MVASTTSKSSTTRKTVSKPDQAAKAAAKALKVANKKTLVTPTGASGNDKFLMPAQEASENVLFAAIPVGFCEKYVPYPTNPPNHTGGRLMIPFYPKGGRENGVGLPMVHCLAQQGLKDPYAVAFLEEVALGKQFVFLSITWPGYYPLLDWLVKIPVFNADGSALTLTGLATIIAKQYRLFYDLCCTDACSNTLDPVWRLGPDGFDFEDIRLAGLWTSGHDVWHASIMVLIPTGDYDTWAKAGLVFTNPKENSASDTLPSTPNDISFVESNAGEDKLDELQLSDEDAGEGRLDELQLSDEEWETLIRGNWQDIFKSIG